MTGARVTPRADDVLRSFFGRRVQAATGRRAERIERAEGDLRACLDGLVPNLFSRQEIALLALERQFDPEHAAARVADAEAVLLVLPVYLDEPRWHGADLTDRRLRIAIASALTDEIIESPALRDLDLGRAAWVVTASVRHEIWMLRQERSATRRR